MTSRICGNQSLDSGRGPISDQIMECKYLRVYITLIAALGAAFAYVCRMNLSIIIKEMTVYGSETSGDPNPTRANIDSRSMWRSIRSEEQALYVMLTSRIDKDSIERMRDRSLSSNQNGSFKMAASKSSEPDTTGADIVKVDWDESTRNLVLQSFFIGYVIFQIPSGKCAEIFGAKTMLLMMNSVTGIMSLLFPVLAKCSNSYVPAFIARLIMGASQSVLFPASYILICEWMPQDERPKWFSIPTTVARIGTIVMYQTITRACRAYGWEVVFYGPGVLTLVWTVVFLIFGSRKPSTSYWISQKELLHIESNQESSSNGPDKQPTLSASGFTINEPAKKPAMSIIKLLTSRPIYILSVVMFTSEWSNMIFLMKLLGILGAWGLEMDQVSDWSSIFVTVFCIQYPLSNYAAARLETYLAANETLERRQEISLRIRKWFEAVSQTLQAVGCLIIAFCSDFTVVIVSLFIIMIGRSTVGGGQCMIPAELSKEYTGTVLAIANSIANIATASGPGIINAMVGDENRPEDWKWFWVLSAAIFALGGVIFCLFAENRPQDYHRKLKHNLPGSISMAQLCDPKSLVSISVIPVDEPIAMDVFSRVGQEPPKEQDANKDNKTD